MRKRSILLALCAAFFLASTPIQAENIGYMDMQRIFKEYSENSDVVAEINTLKQEFQKLVEEKQAEVNKAREEGKDEATLKEMLVKMDNELRPQQDAILQKEFQARRSIMGKISQIAEIVARDYGIDVVLEKQVVYIGGFDLTEFVTDRLNREEKSSKKSKK